MTWQYFTQFWSAVQDVIVGGTTYTIDWFQAIGNAVAGGIGSFFDATFHTLSDLFLFIQWLFANLKVIFTALLSPVNYIFSVIRFFWSSAFLTPPAPEWTYTFPAGVLDVFNTIPHWTIFVSVLGAVVIVFAGIGILKLFLNT
jgi:hypothetical protein